MPDPKNITESTTLGELREQLLLLDVIALRLYPPVDSEEPRAASLHHAALYHHVYDIGRLRAAYFALKRDASAGVDGETWRHYGEALEGNLADLADRLKRGAYHAKPVIALSMSLTA
jgi:hypothetical protein